MYHFWSLLHLFEFLWTWWELPAEEGGDGIGCKDDSPKNEMQWPWCWMGKGIIVYFNLLLPIYLVVCVWWPMGASLSMSSLAAVLCVSFHSSLHCISLSLSFLFHSNAYTINLTPIGWMRNVRWDIQKSLPLSRQLAAATPFGWHHRTAAIINNSDFQNLCAFASFWHGLFFRSLKKCAGKCYWHICWNIIVTFLPVLS